MTPNVPSSTSPYAHLYFKRTLSRGGGGGGGGGGNSLQIAHKQVKKKIYASLSPSNGEGEMVSRWLKSRQGRKDMPLCFPQKTSHTIWHCQN